MSVEKKDKYIVAVLAERAIQVLVASSLAKLDHILLIELSSDHFTENEATGLENADLLLVDHLGEDTVNKKYGNQPTPLHVAFLDIADEHAQEHGVLDHPSYIDRIGLRDREGGYFPPSVIGEAILTLLERVTATHRDNE